MVVMPYSETANLHGMCAGLSSLPLEQQLDILGLSGRSASSWGLIAFSALGPGALATYLETSGQSTVPATQAQVGFVILLAPPTAMRDVARQLDLCQYAWDSGMRCLVTFLVINRPPACLLAADILSGPNLVGSHGPASVFAWRRNGALFMGGRRSGASCKYPGRTKQQVGRHAEETLLQPCMYITIYV